MAIRQIEESNWNIHYNTNDVKLENEGFSDLTYDTTTDDIISDILGERELFSRYGIEL